MNKTELIEKIAKNSGMTKVDADKAVNAFMNIVAETLAKGDKVTLKGFGTFKVHHRKAKVGRNPKTGETVAIAESNVPVFKASTVLKKNINE